jgi:hypothetical protein
MHSIAEWTETFYRDTSSTSLWARRVFGYEVEEISRVDDILCRRMIHALKDRRWSSLDAERAAAGIAELYHAEAGEWWAWPSGKRRGRISPGRPRRGRNLRLRVADPRTGDGRGQRVERARAARRRCHWLAIAMKIDNLAGRELDMAVAKHVLGYECRMTAPSARQRATWSRAGTRARPSSSLAISTQGQRQDGSSSLA